jgi:hypothetical protein
MSLQGKLAQLLPVDITAKKKIGLGSCIQVNTGFSHAIQTFTLTIK